MNLYCLLQGSENIAKTKEESIKLQKKGRRSMKCHLGKTQILTTWRHSSWGCLNWSCTRMGLAIVRQGGQRGSGALTSELFALDNFREKGNRRFYLCTHWWLQQAPGDNFQTNGHRDGPDYMPQNDRENMNLLKGLVGTRGGWLGWEGDPRNHKMEESENITQTKGKTSSLRQENTPDRQLLYL